MAEKFEYTRSWLNEEDFPLLSFSKNWENPSDYPTIETDEAQVRRDMQSLHDEVKDYLNDTLIPRVIAEDATVAAWQAQEDAHAEAEAGRVLAEEARVTAEQDRETAEAEREKEIAKVENLTVSSEALEYGEPASAEVTTNPETGGLNVHFGLPMGKNGLDFLPVIEGDDVPDGVEAWIDPSVESYQGGGGGGGGDGKQEVYVGPNEPTNGEAIWINPDEEEGSFLTKEETEALIAEIPEGIQMELLWENASIKSAFTAQKISLDLSGYQQVEVWATSAVQHGDTPNVSPPTRMPIGTNYWGYLMTDFNSALRARLFKAEVTGVTFDGGTNNEWVIPWKIYGIKGVQ